MSTQLVYEKVLAEVRHLSIADQIRLIEELIADFMQYLKDQQPSGSQYNTEPLYDIQDFGGIGHETWEALGSVDEFLRQERASWDKTYGQS